MLSHALTNLESFKDLGELDRRNRADDYQDVRMIGSIADSNLDVLASNNFGG
jgi:hypothetical protein